MESLHGWQVSSTQASDIQRRLAAQVSKRSEVTAPHFIAGVDMSVGKAEGIATAAVVVLEYSGLRLVETEIAQGKLDFPYIPGLLSFREAPR